MSRRRWSNIDRVDVVDDYTVRVSLREPQATFLPLLARSEAVIVPASLVASGHDFRTRPVGTGPFKFAEREPNVRIRVVRNPDYFEKGIPYLDEIVFVPISDDGTRVNALRSGEVDMIGYAPWKDMTTIERDRRLQLWQQTGPFMCLMFNVNRRPFNDVRVRQAVAYAINRQDVVDIVFHKRGSIITGGIIPAGTWAHNGDLEGMYKYDPDRARRLLREAGYDPSTPIRLMASATHAIHYQTAEIVQAALRQVGMNVVLDLQDWPVAVQRGLRGDYDFRVHGLATIILDPDFYSVWFDGTSTFYARAVGYRDDTIDRLLAQGRALVGRDARKALYHQMEQRLLETVPWTFLSWRVQGDAGLRIIKGYQQLPGGLVSESLVNMRYVWLDK
jgi:peptide/nickel transport system substrate-binding protein